MAWCPQAEQSKSLLTEKALSLPDGIALECYFETALMDVKCILSLFLVLKASTFINLSPLRRSLF